MDVSGNILYVDSHEDTLEVVQRLLVYHGYSVSTARGFQSALSCAQQGRFDLLLAETWLPDGDGVELLPRILQFYPIRGVVLSACGMVKDVERAAAAGFQKHLIKPVDIKLLCKTINQVMAQPPASSPARIIPGMEGEREGAMRRC